LTQSHQQAVAVVVVETKLALMVDLAAVQEMAVVQFALVVRHHRRVKATMVDLALAITQVQAAAVLAQ
jgi:hypothetical protein